MDFLVPKLSATMESATVLRWLKEAGQRVRMGEPLVELETDKAAIEVEAPADGTLESILAPEGTQLPIGAALGRLTTSAAAPGASTAAASSSRRRAFRLRKRRRLSRKGRSPSRLRHPRPSLRHSRRARASPPRRSPAVWPAMPGSS